MKLIQRLGYYLGGFAVGLIILAFIFNKKRTSCSYGPEARVLKNIKSKEMIYDNSFDLNDTSLVNTILKNGNVNFSKSKTREEPCGIYVIEGADGLNDLELTIENCDSLVKVVSFKK